MAAGVLVIVAVVGAGAEGDALTLRYERGPDDCPTAEAFRDLVTARLGRDPFVSDTEDTATVRFDTMGDELVATAEIQRREGTSARTLRAATNQCAALAESVALGLAIALESPPAPARTERAAPAPPPSVNTAPRPLAPPKEAPPPPAVADPLRLAAALGGTAAAGLTPGVSVGVEVGIVLRGTTWGAQVGGRVHTLPSTVLVEDRDPVDATIMTGRVLGCGHLDPWAICIAGDLGAFRARVESATQPGAISTFVALGGVRLAYQADLAPRFLVRAAAELLANLVRTELLLDDATIWSAPPVAGAVTVAFVANIL